MTEKISISEVEFEHELECEPEQGVVVMQEPSEKIPGNLIEDRLQESVSDFEQGSNVYFPNTLI